MSQASDYNREFEVIQQELEAKAAARSNALVHDWWASLRARASAVGLGPALISKIVGEHADAAKGFQALEAEISRRGTSGRR